MPFRHAPGPDKVLVVLEGADHMIFNGHGLRRKETPRDAVIQADVRAITLAFWKATLDGDRQARAWLMGGGAKSMLTAGARYVRPSKGAHEGHRPAGDTVHHLASHAAAIGYEGARHLLNRTGFGAPFRRSRGESPGFARGRRWSGSSAARRRDAVTAPPAFVKRPSAPYYRLREMIGAGPQAGNAQRRAAGLELREWWCREMLTTPSPLTERMTLFWHNHFASSQQKVRFAPLMYRQNVLLRRRRSAISATLLHDVARDPAMLIYLDGAATAARTSPTRISPAR